MKNCTVPVGIPAPGATAAVVALNVTVEPLADAVSTVAVLALPTVCARAAEVEGRKWASPLYTAVMLCAPAGGAYVMEAMPEPLTATVPRLFAPSKNVMVLVGVPPPGGTVVTVAENVRGAPETGVPVVRTGVLTAVGNSVMVRVPVNPERKSAALAVGAKNTCKV